MPISSPPSLTMRPRGARTTTLLLQHRFMISDTVVHSPTVLQLYQMRLQSILPGGLIAIATMDGTVITPSLVIQDTLQPMLPVKTTNSYNGMHQQFPPSQRPIHGYRFTLCFQLMLHRCSPIPRCMLHVTTSPSFRRLCQTSQT